MIQTWTSTLMKKMNEKIILNVIHNKQPISRAEISEISNLASSTVTTIVNDLIHVDLVNETTKGESRGGRKPILLELNDDALYVCGLEWGISEIKSVLINLNGGIVDSQKAPVYSHELEYFIETTKSMIEAYKIKVGDPTKIHGVGLGVHGIVNAQEGLLLLSPHFKWENVALKDQLEASLQYNLMVDNDVRMMAYAEKWKGKEEFIFIYSGYGIGAAFVLNDQLYYGKDWSAGEIGHMKIVENGPRCVCGARGCLDALISLPSLVRRYDPDCPSEATFHHMQKRWLTIVANARLGEEKAIELLEDTGKYLGKAISNVINFVNPEAIVIGGNLIEAKDIILPVVEQQIEENVLRTCRKNIEFNSSDFGDLMGPIGSANKVLEQIFVVSGAEQSLSATKNSILIGK